MNIECATPRPSSPTQSSLRFARALSVGDLDLAAASFTRDGCLITPDATAIHGRDRIRSVLAQMVIRQTEIRIELSSTIDAGEVILASQRWRIRSGGCADRRIEQTSNAILVLRQIEAEWKMAIAAPWGHRHVHP
jgi:ketosteroid isomerase-like protein